MPPITLILTRDGDQILRKFEPSLALTVFGKALKKLDDGILKAQFPPSSIPELNAKAAIFQDPQDVPWYLDKIGRELFVNHKKRYRLKVKACGGFLYIRLQVQVRRKWKLLIRPFFHASPLPKSGSKANRGFADTLLFIAPQLKNKGQDAKELFKWYEIDIDARCKKFERDRLTLAFEPKVRVFPGDVDIGKKCIDYEDLQGRSKSVLVASKNVRTAIKRLAEVWHNPLPRSVLLSAWTGSGKEVLKSLFLYACCVPENRVIEAAAPELAASGDFCKEIYSRLRNHGLFDLKKKKKQKENKGQIELLAHTVLFLDEIHHPEAAKLRPGLLRSMETDEITDGKDKVSTKFLTYLFAASESPEQLRKLRPPDFWNRIEYNVVMAHPLLLRGKDRADTLQQYFCLFWRGAADTRIKALGKDVDEEELRYIKVLQTDAILKISKEFVAVLGSPLIPAVSMRTIRTIVGRLFGMALYLAQTEQPLANELADRVTDKLNDWATNICRQIVPELKPKGLF